MSEVLARVITRTLDVPRGPDVVHRIRVPQAWLESGEVVEFELPRNLSCAACEGGGCDSCERSGAITLRGRQELPEILHVTLPARTPEANGEARGVVIRIPEQGGLPPEHGDVLPRGLLLLRVEIAEAADPGVTRALQPEPPESRERLSLRIPRPSRKQLRLIALAVTIVLLAGLAILTFRRFRGLG
ncbi:MAG: hypothetical protein ABIQ16_05030 [Polyangiaceae bacterium]